ncbi:hypothetical protein FisN_17Lh223 [Fistulifera solaris]|uniref:CAP-Gly domain-containing protein n=1 Tax=Fistulifera solaris TaxID=1519565 RepID=A0A1Z5KIP2_FISSO|nr:hypothetical protein FisN_17Lh223 [Fistulifera solaris]|eukprot:GAX25818.1 hypothetical protein FisN_17Lh223 [Fistulifera solaris]
MDKSSNIIRDEVTNRTWHIGKTRIRDASGCTATVVYIGPVASAKDPTEIYCGVVWDDFSRGKHDGSVVDRTTGNLVRHFHAPHPTSGSFLRIGKVDGGVELSPLLLRERYVTLNSDELVAPHNLLPHTVQTASGRNDKVVEFLGELKIRSQQQLEDLTTVSLRRWGISSVQKSESWSSLNHFTEVDLAGNLLFDWKDVATLLHVLPNLRNLSLACNRLGDVEFPDDMPQCLSLTHLNVRQTEIKSVESIMALGYVFPHLQELSLADCPIQCRSDDAKPLAAVFANLTFLDCTHCEFDTNSQVLAWAFLPKLESLSLDDNPLLENWDGLDPEQHFSSLENLQLAGTGWKNWKELTVPLHHLPKLNRLRLRNCPLQNGLGSGGARMITIGHLPKLQMLNGSLITNSERKDAARWFVRTIRRMQQENQETDPANTSLKLDDNPQYIFWTTNHPDFVEGAQPISGSNGSSKALIDSIVSVTIRSMAANSCTMEPLVRRFPADLTVGRLKALCSRYFGLDLDLQALHYRASPDQGFPTAMESDECTLAYYGVPDGAEILVNELDAEALNNEKQQAERNLIDRVQKQEKELAEFQTRQRHADIR